MPQPLVAFERVALPRPAGRVAAAAAAAGRPGRRQQRVDAPPHASSSWCSTATTSPRPASAWSEPPRDSSSRTTSALTTTSPCSRPAALASATQDFTTDKARLLAAVDQFTGMKMMSAIIEVDREQAAAEAAAAVPSRCTAGRIPSDSERSDRALALSGTLEALAAHLERIPGRRKSLLLFSEGVDYDTADVLGQVQRNASDVMRGMSRAIGALMRTNVAVYAIDPRGANLADADLLETPLISQAGMRERAGRTQPVRRAERFDSDPALAVGFDRRVRGGQPQRLRRCVRPHHRREQLVLRRRLHPAAPRQAWRVSTDRGEGVAAGREDQRPERLHRQGRAGAPRQPAGHERAAVRFPDAVHARPRPGAGAGRTCRPRRRRPRDSSSPLQALLASPLPQPGLPIRVQAVTLGGDGRKTEVRLVVEVLGRSLQFEERGGRFNERIELALLTVNDSGKRVERHVYRHRSAADARGSGAGQGAPACAGSRHSNCRRAAISSGSRDGPSGTGVSGMITHDFVVPESRRRGVDLSGVTLTSVPSVLMITKGKAVARAGAANAADRRTDVRQRRSDRRGGRGLSCRRRARPTPR